MLIYSKTFPNKNAHNQEVLGNEFPEFRINVNTGRKFQ